MAFGKLVQLELKNRIGGHSDLNLAQLACLANASPASESATKLHILLLCTKSLAVALDEHARNGAAVASG